MKGTDGEEVGRWRLEREGGEQTMVSRCIINCSEMS